MIYIENSHINHLIAANEKLSVGMDFLRLIRSESFVTLSQGMVPVIAGGAVRDGLFPGKTGHEVADIDVFFHRAITSDASTAFGTRAGTRAEQQAYTIALTQLRENVLVWLEDNEIEHESLLSDQAAEYFGSQRFLDIISFEWHGVTIQVMIPNNYLSLSSSSKSFLTTMPMISGACLSLDRLVMTPSFLAALNAPQGVSFAGMDVDIPYLRRKYPNNRVIFFNNQGMMIGRGLQGYFEGTDISNLSGRRVAEFTSSAVNSHASVSSRAASDFLDIPIGNITYAANSPMMDVS